MKFNDRTMALLGVPDLPERAFIRKAGGGITPQGGGSAPSTASSGSSTGTSTTGLPSWAEPYAQETLAKQAALSNLPYEAYDAPRIAGFTPMQEAARAEAEGMQTSPQLGTATGLAERAGTAALGTQYDPYATGQWAQQAGSYMSPYMQNVVDIQQREAQRQADIAGQRQQAQFTQAGAFGGSRDAIMRAEAARNLALQKGDIQAQGLQNAYQSGLGQFNTEQGLREQSRQYGAGLGMQGLQAGLSAAGQLGQLGGQQFQQGINLNQLRGAYGAQQQAMGQAGLSQAYQDWQRQRDYPQQQLTNMAGMLRGIPVGSTTSGSSSYSGTGSGTTGSPSFLQSLGSLGSAAWGLKQFFADGGSVDSQENIKSIVSKLSNQQLDQAEQAAKARGDIAQLEAIQMEKAARASMQRGIAAAPVDMDKMLPTEESMARGGIVAFNGDDESLVDSSGYNPYASPSSYTGADASADDVDLTSDELQQASRAALRQMQQQAADIAGYKNESLSPADYNKVIEDRYAMFQRMAGASPYEGMRADVKRMDEESAKNLKQAKGIAALRAASAMLEGNNAFRGLAKGATTFSESYGEAVKADQAQKRALRNMEINIADAERKEKMGFTRDAIAAADQARRDKQDANRAAIQKAQALANVNRGIATATRTGAAKPPAAMKLPEQLAEAELALSKDPKNPELQARAKALRSAVSQTRSSFSMADWGPTRTGVEGQKIEGRKEEVSTRTNAAINAAVEKSKLMDPGYQEALSKGDTAGMEAAKDRMYDAIAKRQGAAAPARGPNAPKPPATVTNPTVAQFNAKWATLKTGESTIGPDGKMYTKK